MPIGLLPRKSALVVFYSPLLLAQNLLSAKKSPTCRRPARSISICWDRSVRSATCLRLLFGLWLVCDMSATCPKRVGNPVENLVLSRFWLLSKLDLMEFGHNSAKGKYNGHICALFSDASNEFRQELLFHMPEPFNDWFFYSVVVFQLCYGRRRSWWWLRGRASSEYRRAHRKEMSTALQSYCTKFSTAPGCFIVSKTTTLSRPRVSKFTDTTWTSCYSCPV